MCRSPRRHAQPPPQGPLTRHQLQKDADEAMLPLIPNDPEPPAAPQRLATSGATSAASPAHSGYTTDPQTTQFRADFNTVRTILICPNCSAEGKFVLNGAGSQPQSRMAKCTKCTKRTTRKKLNCLVANTLQQLRTEAATPQPLATNAHHRLAEPPHTTTDTAIKAKIARQLKLALAQQSEQFNAKIKTLKEVILDLRVELQASRDENKNLRTQLLRQTHAGTLAIQASDYPH
ncbi:hypothetical protein BWQ96_10908 [Gracilariopsis chorda]|uniref:Uncharacterized protein n=1 Tax=Gracilariopsis chorda TaxID=448386 RepID=A0A2V3IBB4_9FLOR|nr:hypothetical protein BWQ96_10908 [Gracilariopsis chorda]|eukprot:PXF39403.1 hypothetical protein BWQ96_10908 [Gracilariopsis chorda]